MLQELYADEICHSIRHIPPVFSPLKLKFRLKVFTSRPSIPESEHLQIKKNEYLKN